jgi:hypothetical protein
VDIQGELFRAIDGFLGTLGRIALIFFPQQEATNPTRRARAEHLRKLLQIDTSHAFADKTLRNKWTHYDEILDEYYETRSGQVQPQRFTTSADLVGRPDDSTIRLLVMDTLDFRYRGFGE